MPSRSKHCFPWLTPFLPNCSHTFRADLAVWTLAMSKRNRKRAGRGLRGQARACEGGSPGRGSSIWKHPRQDADVPAAGWAAGQQEAAPALTPRPCLTLLTSSLHSSPCFPTPYSLPSSGLRGQLFVPAAALRSETHHSVWAWSRFPQPAPTQGPSAPGS